MIIRAKGCHGGQGILVTASIVSQLKLHNGAAHGVCPCHATVLHACRTVNNLMDTDKKFRGYIDELEKKISVI